MIHKSSLVWPIQDPLLIVAVINGVRGIIFKLVIILLLFRERGNEGLASQMAK